MANKFCSSNISSCVLLALIYRSYGHINSAENNGPNCHVQFSSENFDKHWPFLDLFKSCTFYVSIKADACWQLSNSFIRKCIVYQNCISIYSGIVQNRKKGKKQKYRTKGQINFEDTTFTFKNIIFKHKYSAFCIVQLPSTRINQKGHFQLIHYMGKRKWISLLSTSRRHPDYFLIPTMDTPTEESWTYLPKEWPLKVLVLKGNPDTTKIIYLVCFGCVVDKRLVTLQFQFHLSLISIQRMWNYYHANLINKIKLRRILPIAILQQLGLLLQSEMRIANFIIAQHYNCTKFTCDPESWGLRTGYFTANINHHFTAVGATFPGFKFSLIGKASSNQQFSLKTLKLLGAAFSSGTKFALVVSLFLLASFINYGYGLNSTVFWVFSVTFEQGRVDHLAKLSLKCLVSIWLLGSLYIRILYTTDMYTDITGVPVPTTLPTTLPMLLGESIEIKTGTCSKERLSRQWITNRVSGITHVGPNNTFSHRFVERMYNRSHEFHLGQLTLGQDHLKSRIPENKLTWSTNSNDQLYPEPTKEFAMLYETNACSDKFLNRIISLLDKRTIYENNDPPVLSKVKVVNWRKNTYFTKFAVQAFWRLVESGIYNFMQNLIHTFFTKKYFIR